MSLCRVFFNSYIYSAFVPPENVYTWRAYVDALTASTDIAYGVAVDSSRNVYLVGGNGAVSANVYNSDGSLSSLTVPVGSGFIVKYDETGVSQWRAYVDAASSTDVGYAVACEGTSNVYLAGYNGGVAANVYSSDGSSGSSVPINSGFLVKYGSDGMFKWRSYIDATSSSQLNYGVALDPTGNVYVAGTNGSVAATIFNSDGTSSGTTVPLNSAYLVKYDSNGTFLWRSYVDVTASTESGFGLAVDSTSNVYLVGSTGAGTAVVFHSNAVSSGLTIPATSAFVAKWNSQGTVQWRAYVDGATTSDIAYGVTTDANQNVYITGTTGTTVANVFTSAGTVATGCRMLYGSSGFLVKYTPTGGVAWRVFITNNNATGNPSIIENVVVDSTSNVYIVGRHSTGVDVGYIYNSNVYSDSQPIGDITGGYISTPGPIYSAPGSAFLYKYDSTGKWLARCIVNSQLGSSADFAYGVALDSQNSVYMVGNNPLGANIYNSNDIISNVFLPTSSAFLVKFNSNLIQDTLTTTYKRWPPKDILYGDWSGVAPNYSNVVSGTSYGTGTYNITSNIVVVSGAEGAYDHRRLWDNSNTWNITVALYDNVSPRTHQIQFPSAVAIRLYAIYPMYLYASWTTWQLQGSNDGTNWTTIDTKTLNSTIIDHVKGNGLWTYVNNVIPCSYYRFLLTAPASGNLYIRNVRMYSYETDDPWYPTFGRLFDAPTSESAIGISTDSSSNVYVGGYYNGAVGNIFSVTSTRLATLPASSGQAGFISKFTSNGTYQYSLTFDALTTDSSPQVVCDSFSNLYVSGYYGTGSTVNVSYVSTTNVASVIATLPAGADAFVSKFTSNGTYQYSRILNSSGAAQLDGSPTVDSFSNVYVCGYYTGSTVTIDYVNSSNTVTTVATLPASSGQDAVVLKYASDGTYQYALRLTTTGTDVAYATKCDANSNLYVAGTFSGSANANIFYISSSGVSTQLGFFAVSAAPRDSFVSAFDSNGAYRFSLTMTGGTGTDDFYTLACDSQSNVYVGGYYAGASAVINQITNSNVSTTVGTLPTPGGAGGTASCVIKFTNTGTYLYSIIIDAAGSSFDYVFAIAVDSKSSIYIVGDYTGSPSVNIRNTSNVNTSIGTLRTGVGGRTGYLCKINSNATAIEYVRYIDSSGTDTPNYVWVDSNDNVYWSGTYSAAGNLLDTGGNTIISLPAVGAGGTTAFMFKFTSNGSYIT